MYIEEKCILPAGRGDVASSTTCVEDLHRTGKKKPLTIVKKWIKKNLVNKQDPEPKDSITNENKRKRIGRRRNRKPHSEQKTLESNLNITDPILFPPLEKSDSKIPIIATTCNLPEETKKFNTTGRVKRIEISVIKEENGYSRVRANVIESKEKVDEKMPLRVTALPMEPLNYKQAIQPKIKKYGFLKLIGSIKKWKVKYNTSSSTSSESESLPNTTNNEIDNIPTPKIEPISNKYKYNHPVYIPPLKMKRPFICTTKLNDDGFIKKLSRKIWVPKKSKLPLTTTTISLYPSWYNNSTPFEKQSISPLISE